METNTAKIVRRLKSEGGFLGQPGAPPDTYTNPKREKIRVPRHRTVPPGVAQSIARKAGWGA